MRGFAGDPPPLATQGEPESAALLLVSTSADTPLQWLRVGEVTSAILLTATRHGLAASPLTQPLEVGDTRTFIRNHVSGDRSSHPQILLRIGWPRPESGTCGRRRGARSPRWSTDDRTATRSTANRAAHRPTRDQCPVRRRSVA